MLVRYVCRCALTRTKTGVCAELAQLSDCPNDSYYLTYSQWLLNDFLGYLGEWEVEIAEVPGLDQKEQQKLCLSRETMEGLKITGMIPWPVVSYAIFCFILMVFTLCLYSEIIHRVGTQAIEATGCTVSVE